MPATYELRRILPDKLARIMAWVTGAILLVICLFMFLMFMFAPPRVEPQAPKSLPHLPDSLSLVRRILGVGLRAIDGAGLQFCGEEEGRRYF